jgi:hypothetical protein
MSGVFPNHRVIRLRVQLNVRCFWYIRNAQRVEKRETEKFREDPKVVWSILEGVSEQRGIKYSLRSEITVGY